jgi:flagellar hook-length control protein FliK
MSIVRAVAGNRTLLDRNRVDETILGDAPAGGASFPATLGAAANTVDASTDGDPAAALQIKAKAKHASAAQANDSESSLAMAAVTVESGNSVSALANSANLPPVLGPPTGPADTSHAGAAATPSTIAARMGELGSSSAVASGSGASALTSGATFPQKFGAAIIPADARLGGDPATAGTSTSGAMPLAARAAQTSPADMPQAGEPASAPQSEVKTKPSNATRMDDAGASSATTSGSSANALQADRIPSFIQDSVGQADGEAHHRVRQLPHRADGAEVAAATTSWTFLGAVPAARSRTDESSAASVVSHVGSATPLSNWKELAVGQDPSAQSASTISATAEQAPQPHEGRLGKDVSSADSLVFGTRLPAPLKHASGSDLLPAPLVKEIPSVASADPLPAPSGTTLQEQAALHSTLPSGSATDLTSNLVDTAGLSAPQTGGGSRVPETTLGDLADRLSHHLIKLAGGDAHELVLQLHPPELGDVTVGVLVNGRDVSAWFVSPQAQVQQAISEAIGQLHTSLDNAGYNLNGTWIGADARSPGQWDGTSSTPQQRRSPATRLSADEASELPTLSPASRISVYV